MMTAVRATGERRGFLARLRRDTRGNTMAIMAAALVPLIGFTGSAVDMARLYVIKVRLQQACDAGVLAGRKIMTDTNPGTPMDPQAKQQAQSFFTNNFVGGWFGNVNPVFTPNKMVVGNSQVANAVSATATVTVPMTVMKFFGTPDTNIVVNCQARFDVADNDVMFVLDTTGSMSCYPTDPTNCATPTASFTRDDQSTGYHNPEKPQTTYNSQPLYSKIESLRQAVLLFDQTVRASADQTTHFRYGFVPYTSAVNVGRAILAVSPQSLQNGTYTYDSRHLSPLTGSGGMLAGDYGYGSATSVTLTGIPQSYCVEQRYPQTGFSRTGPSWNDAGYYQAMHYYGLSWSAANNGTCSGQQQPMRPYWRYEPTSIDVSQYSAFHQVTTPGRLDGATSLWRGCIEEADTTAATSFDVNNLPYDLNPDLIPSSNATKWRPMWQDAVWLRPPGGAVDIQDDTVTEVPPPNPPQNWQPPNWQSFTFKGGDWLDQAAFAACGMPAKELQTMSSQQVHDYLYDNDFTPAGGTYHDVGMIWGTRMLSPSGVFANDTAAWPGRNPPNRTIIFMTDGTMATSPYTYGQYGVEGWDNRVGSGFNSSDGDNRHAARLRVECDAAKARGMTIYTVAVGLHGAAVPDLDYCSSLGQTYFADDSASLKSVFQQIAQRVAMLRITQ